MSLISKPNSMNNHNFKNPISIDDFEIMMEIGKGNFLMFISLNINILEIFMLSNVYNKVFLKANKEKLILKERKQFYMT